MRLSGGNDGYSIKVWVRFGLPKCVNFFFLFFEILVNGVMVKFVCSEQWWDYVYLFDKGNDRLGKFR